ncbi:MAG: GspH/FimT family pseudopilin [Arenicellales bacterium]
MNNNSNPVAVNDSVAADKKIRNTGSRSLLIYSSRLKPRSSLGFTLVEMLIVMSVVGVLISIALPGFSSLVIGSKLDSAVDKITEAISYSRNLSLNNRNNERIVICPSSDHNNPTVVNPSCSAAAEQDYSEGWLMFIDCNGDEMFDAVANLCDGLTTPEELINVQTRFKDITLESSDANRIVFDRSGRTLSTTNFTVKNDGQDYATVSVNNLGRMSLTHHDYNW